MVSGILIEPIINNKAHGIAFQAKRFSFSIRITNHSNTPSKEFNISEIRMFSETGQNLSDNFNGNKYYVRVLNPNESIVLDIGKNGQFISGLINYQAKMVPDVAGEQITFLQKNPFSEDISEIERKNEWLDFCYMKSLSEYTQERANKIMIALTIILLFLTILQVGKTFEDPISTLVVFLTKSTYNTPAITNQIISLLAGLISALFLFKISNEKNEIKSFRNKIRFIFNDKS